MDRTAHDLPASSPADVAAWVVASLQFALPRAAELVAELLAAGRELEAAGACRRLGFGAQADALEGLATVELAAAV